MDLFRKSVPPLPRVAQANPIAVRRHHGLRICIPGLEGMLV
jgi:hypothetical protein